MTYLFKKYHSTEINRQKGERKWCHGIFTAQVGLGQTEAGNRERLRWPVRMTESQLSELSPSPPASSLGGCCLPECSHYLNPSPSIFASPWIFFVCLFWYLLSSFSFTHSRLTSLPCIVASLHF